jgi:hypothetical protein
MTDTKEKLSTLMDAVVDTLLDQVQNGTNEVTKDGELVKVPASAAILNVARQLLKDNNIEPSKRDPRFQTLVSSLPFDESVPAKTH